MKKRGTHVGVVISFMIFVTFLVFLYTIVQPAIRTGTSKQTLLDPLEEDLISWVSTDLTTVSIGIDKTATQNCLKLNNLITKTEINTTLVVINDSGNTFNSYVIGSTGNFGLLIDRTGSETDFFKVRISEEFDSIGPGGPSGCGDLNEGSGYNIGLIRTDKYVFESKVGESMEEYKNDYEGIKDILKVSDEFGFGFTYANDTVIKTEDVNVPISVFAREIPIQYIDEEASIVSGLINIRIW